MTLIASLRLAHERGVERLADNRLSAGDLAAFARIIEMLKEHVPPVVPEVTLTYVSLEKVEVTCRDCKAKHVYLITNKGGGNTGHEASEAEAKILDEAPPAPPPPPPSHPLVATMPAPNDTRNFTAQQAAPVADPIAPMYFAPSSNAPSVISPTMRACNRAAGYTTGSDGKLGKGPIVRRAVSAFGGKGDIGEGARMSANDPKRTWTVQRRT